MKAVSIDGLNLDPLQCLYSGHVCTQYAKAACYKVLALPALYLGRDNNFLRLSMRVEDAPRSARQSLQRMRHHLPPSDTPKPNAFNFLVCNHMPHAPRSTNVVLGQVPETRFGECWADALGDLPYD